jgi:hypothetical protein
MNNLSLCTLLANVASAKELASDSILVQYSFVCRA